MGEIISLHNEVKLLHELKDDTVVLIHHTEVIDAIKKLIVAYEIIDLNLAIEKNYAEFAHQPPWDLSAFKDLNQIRCEIASTYAFAFDPLLLVTQYYQKMGTLFTVLNLRL